MLIQLLFEDPRMFLMAAVSFLFSLSVHEYSHAQTSYSLGDESQKEQGRLTINPMNHIDPLGAVCFFIFGFGWGRPVAFDYYSIRNKKWGPALIALAGPLSNILLALLSGFFLRFLPFGNYALANFFAIFAYFNLVFAVFNILPFPPLDGHHIFFAAFPALEELKRFLLQNIIISILLAVMAMDYIVVPFVIIPLFKIITGQTLLI